MGAFGFLHPLWCTCGGKMSISYVISHREGPGAAKLETADALNGFWRLPTHYGKGLTGFS